ncbi:NADP-dependent D-sorbitol-6-phosphate dehydrogenase [Ananas comosus]|uniref:NADP-dependent D-sorbitol-6-phosphate dehydrogenase n=1 Tax=Ananas comosus TaxID=4615 RepID=A0A199UMQ0_ANACO|nr:NADP-dependent D-sorbitol-6-phosphate dehydrogenase [Ananas comosus]
MAKGLVEAKDCPATGSVHAAMLAVRAVLMFSTAPPASTYSKIKPAVNQIETHPYFQRDSLVKFCQKHGICVTAHTPLGGAAANAEWFGSISCLEDPVIKTLAEKYNKTVAQLVLQWGVQRNTAVIPKSSKVERLRENFQIFNFTISDEDMEKIKTIDRKCRTNQPAKFWGIDLYA